MNRDSGWRKAMNDYLFFEPQQHIVSRAPLIISKIMIQRQFRNRTRHQQVDCLIWPVNPPPSIWGLSFIIQKYFH